MAADEGEEEYRLSRITWYDYIDSVEQCMMDDEYHRKGSLLLNHRLNS